MVLGLSVNTWIPANLASEPIFEQFAGAVDYLLSADYNNSELMLQNYQSLKNKYINLKDVPDADVLAIINESGYSYITETINLTTDQMRTFLNFLAFIHINKGTRKGFEFVLTLLGMNFEITEWWEITTKYATVRDPMTFSIDLLSVSADQVQSLLDTVEKVKTFARNYVYPIINYILLELDLDHGYITFASAYQGTADYTFAPDDYFTTFPKLFWDDYSEQTLWDNSVWS